LESVFSFVTRYTSTLETGIAGRNKGRKYSDGLRGRVDSGRLARGGDSVQYLNIGWDHLLHWEGRNMTGMTGMMAGAKNEIHYSLGRLTGPR